MTVTEEQAIEIARMTAERRGWPFVGRVRVTVRRRFHFFGAATAWEVWTNSDHRGRNVRVAISCADGRVLDAGYLSR